MGIKNGHAAERDQWYFKPSSTTDCREEDEDCE
jgi:hypothetical protein